VWQGCDDHWDASPRMCIQRVRISISAAAGPGLGGDPLVGVLAASDTGIHGLGQPGGMVDTSVQVGTGTGLVRPGPAPHG